jgi:anti-sigma factor RsiW
MKVTRDVVMDLLPLYVAGEASADTRALVDEFLDGDPELRREVGEGRLDALLSTGAAGSVPPDVELRALRRTRGLLRWQRLTYAWALTVSFLSFSTAISFEGGQLHFRLLLADHPGIFALCLVLASGLWAAYSLLRRRTRGSQG